MQICDDGIEHMQFQSNLIYETVDEQSDTILQFCRRQLLCIDIN